MVDIEKLVRENLLFDGHYQMIKPLSKEGGTADVWLARDVNTIDNDIDGVADEEMLEETGMLVAIKIYRPKNALDIEGEQRFRDEYKIVYDCRHTNLLQPTSFSIYDEVPYLVMPFCQNGSSQTLVGQLTDEGEIWRFIHDVASGLAYLHANDPQIIHQDIKPGNILIDNAGNFAITDFGISSRQGAYHEYCYDDGNCGTMAYMAPERFAEVALPLPEGDIWAFGATLHELITGNVPFGEDGGQAQTDDWSGMQPITGVSSDIMRLLNACLSKDPAKRPTAAYIEKAALAHQYPIKKKSKWPLFVIVFLLLAGVGAGAFFLLKQKDEELKVQQTKQNEMQKQLEEATKDAVPVEQVYAHALKLANMNDADSLNVGLQLLDSIGRLDYIPALQEEALTYGWYSDKMSVQRKQLLGIRTYEDGENDFLPIDDAINRKAVDRLNRIIDLNDTEEYIDITAGALYRLACYYCNTDKVYANDYDKALGLLRKSLELAKESGNRELIGRCEAAISVIESDDEEE